MPLAQLAMFFLRGTFDILVKLKKKAETVPLGTGIRILELWVLELLFTCFSSNQ